MPNGTTTIYGDPATDDKGNWVISTTVGLVVSTDNGSTWEYVGTAGVTRSRSVQYINGMFVAHTDTTWTNRDLANAPAYVYATSGDLMNWSNGYLPEDLMRMNWYEFSAGPINGQDSIIFGNGDLLSGAPGVRYDKAWIASSTNGVDATELTFSGNTDLSQFNPGDALTKTTVRDLVSVPLLILLQIK